MPTVTLATFCHPPHYVRRLHEPGVLQSILDTHRYSFDEVVVIHQRCKAADYPSLNYRTVDLPEEEIEPLLRRFGVNPVNPRGDELTHGPSGPHFWRYHLCNHLRGLEVTASDYIVFADCDTYMKAQPPDRTWIEEGISILERYAQVLIVSPGDGGHMHEAMLEGERVRLTRNVSQQLFLCRGYQFRTEISFDVEWDGEMNAPGGPFPEFYDLLEGRLWRYMRQEGMWRAILPDTWRYWHDSYWAQGSGVN